MYHLQKIKRTFFSPKVGRHASGKVGYSSPFTHMLAEMFDQSNQCGSNENVMVWCLHEYMISSIDKSKFQYTFHDRAISLTITKTLMDLSMN